jgi:hypothetical protein
VHAEHGDDPGTKTCSGMVLTKPSVIGRVFGLNERTRAVVGKKLGGLFAMPAVKAGEFTALRVPWRLHFLVRVDDRVRNWSSPKRKCFRTDGHTTLLAKET